MKGFKTLTAASAITIIGGLQQAGIVDLIPENYRGVSVATIGLLMAGLRLVTKTPALKAY